VAWIVAQLPLFTLPHYLDHAQAPPTIGADAALVGDPTEFVEEVEDEDRLIELFFGGL
jgi:hypothetical protein